MQHTSAEYCNLSALTWKEFCFMLRFVHNMELSAEELARRRDSAYYLRVARNPHGPLYLTRLLAGIVVGPLRPEGVARRTCKEATRTLWQDAGVPGLSMLEITEGEHAGKIAPRDILSLEATTYRYFADLAENEHTRQWFPPSFMRIIFFVGVNRLKNEMGIDIFAPSAPRALGMLEYFARVWHATPWDRKIRSETRRNAARQYDQEKEWTYKVLTEFLSRFDRRVEEYHVPLPTEPLRRKKREVSVPMTPAAGGPSAAELDLPLGERGSETEDECPRGVQASSTVCSETPHPAPAVIPELDPHSNDAYIDELAGHDDMFSVIDPVTFQADMDAWNALLRDGDLLTLPASDPAAAAGKRPRAHTFGNEDDLY